MKNHSTDAVCEVDNETTTGRTCMNIARDARNHDIERIDSSKSLSVNGAPTESSNSSISSRPARTICSSCQSAEAKYKCPACLISSCSLPCVRKHKLATGCTGLRDPVKMVQPNDMNEEMLQSDYRFLEGVRTRLEECLREPKLHHLEEETPHALKMKYRNKQQGRSSDFTPKVQNTSNYSAEQRARFKHLIPNYRSVNPLYAGPGVLVSRNDIPHSLKRLRHEARQRGTQLAFMPRDMSRRNVNTTHFAAKLRVIRWHVRVEFLHADAQFETTVDENISVGRIIANLINIPVEKMQGNFLEHNSSIDNHQEGLHFNIKNCIALKKKRDGGLDGPGDPLEGDWCEQRASNGSEINETSQNNASNFNSFQLELNTDIADRSSLIEKQPPDILYRNSLVSKDANNLNIEMKDSTNRLHLQHKTTILPFTNNRNLVDELCDSMSLNQFCDAPITESKPTNSSTSDVSGLVTHLSESNNNNVPASPQPLSLEQQEQMTLYRASGIGQLAVVCKNEKFGDYRKYLQMDMNDSLKNNMAGWMVVEYPILMVVRKEHAYEMINLEGTERIDLELDHIFRSAKIKESRGEQEQQQENTFKYFDADCDEQYMNEI